MYHLCELMFQVSNNSMLHHPMNVVEQSESLDEIKKRLADMVTKGSCRDALRVYKEIDFDVDCVVTFKPE